MVAPPMTVVAPGILVGSVIGAQDVNALRANGVTHVLNAAGAKCPNFFPQHFQYKSLPITDTPSQNIMNYFPETNAFIADARARGGSVFVHCVEGKSRSASCVIAYLMSTSGMSVDQALMQLKSARPIVNPNDGFLIQLRHFEQMLRSGGAPQMSALPTPQGAAPMAGQQVQQQRLQHQQQRRQQQQLQMQQRQQQQQLQQQQQQQLQQQQLELQQQQQLELQQQQLQQLELQQQQVVQQQPPPPQHVHTPVMQQVMVQASIPNFPQPDPPLPLQQNQDAYPPGLPVQPERPRPPPQNLHSEVQKMSVQKAQERAKAQRDTFAMFTMQQQQNSPPADPEEHIPPEFPTQQATSSDALFRSGQDDAREASPVGEQIEGPPRPAPAESSHPALRSRPTEGFAPRRTPAESSHPSLRSRPIEGFAPRQTPAESSHPSLRSRPVPSWESTARARSPIDRAQAARAAPQARATAPFDRVLDSGDQSPPSQPQPPWTRPRESAPWQPPNREGGERAVKASASPKVIAAAPWEGPPRLPAWEAGRMERGQRPSPVPNSELISRLPSLGGVSPERRKSGLDSDRFSDLNQVPDPGREMMTRVPSDRFSPAAVVPNEELDPDFKMSELAARQMQEIMNGQDDDDHWEEEDSLGAVRRLTVVGGQIAKELIC